MVEDEPNLDLLLNTEVTAPILDADTLTGVSVSRYIQNELILHSKRMLVYTSLTVREISIHLGIDDYAYFTRLFTKAVGISPTLYRKKYLE